MRNAIVLLAVAGWLGAWLASGGCNSDGEQGKTSIRVFMADSLFQPLEKAQAGLQAAQPGIEATLIPSGSVLAARKIVDSGDQADVLAVADYMVIDRLMRPKFADWYICFATNEIVIAYTNASRGAATLTADNWFEVLSRDDVKVGAANPYHDPCGYWTELVWQLADRHYARAGGESVSDRMHRKCGESGDRRSDSEELLQILESAAGLDYAFVYRSQALQHNLPALRLPPEVNLGDISKRDHYRQVSITLPGTERSAPIQKQGDAVVYALTIPKNARQPDAAVRYVQFLLGPAGRKILEEQHLMLAPDPWTYDLANVPADLRPLITERARTTSAPSTTHAN